MFQTFHIFTMYYKDFEYNKTIEININIFKLRQCLQVFIMYVKFYMGHDTIRYHKCVNL